MIMRVVTFAIACGLFILAGFCTLIVINMAAIFLPHVTEEGFYVLSMIVLILSILAHEGFLWANVFWARSQQRVLGRNRQLE